MLEKIMVEQASMFLPGIPIVKHSGKTKLNYFELQNAFEKMNPKLILIENESGDKNQKFSLMVGQQYYGKINLRDILESHPGIVYNGPHFIHANEEAMMQTIGLALIKLSKKL